MTDRNNIFEGDDAQHAQFIRSCVKSLGHEIPANWSNEQVVMFFNDLTGDQPRIWTDMDKADMKYEAQIAE